jgi:hypothetical protein
MQLGGVTRAECRGNAALCPRRGGIAQRALGEDDDIAMVRGAPGGVEAGNARSNDQESRADAFAQKMLRLM